MIIILKEDSIFGQGHTFFVYGSVAWKWLVLESYLLSHEKTMWSRRPSQKPKYVTRKIYDKFHNFYHSLSAIHIIIHYYHWRNWELARLNSEGAWKGQISAELLNMRITDNKGHHAKIVR